MLAPVSKHPILVALYEFLGEKFGEEACERLVVDITTSSKSEYFKQGSDADEDTLPHIDVYLEFGGEIPEDLFTLDYTADWRLKFMSVLERVEREAGYPFSNVSKIGFWRANLNLIPDRDRDFKAPDFPEQLYAPAPDAELDDAADSLPVNSLSLYIRLAV